MVASTNPLRTYAINKGRTFCPSTSTSATILGLDGLGTVAAGMSADFIVLNANPLDGAADT